MYVGGVEANLSVLGTMFICTDRSGRSTKENGKKTLHNGFHNGTILNLVFSTKS